MYKLLTCTIVVALSSLCFADEPKTGPFDKTFSERSPLSEIKSVARRFGLSKQIADYDLSNYPCWVFVPEDYDSTKLIGLVVMLTYHEADDLPQQVLSQFAEANVALVVPKKEMANAVQRAGLALDVVHNMRKDYTIDSRRVYVFGFDKDATAEQLGLGFPDVFNGSLCCFFEIYRQVRVPGKENTYWTPKLTKPDAKHFNMAMKRAFVLASLERDEQWESWAQSFTDDGFKFVKHMVLSPRQVQYPDLTKDWIPDVIKFMDEATAKLPKPKPTPPKSGK